MLGSLRRIAVFSIATLAACNGGTGAVDVHGDVPRGAAGAPTDQITAAATSERSFGIALYAELAHASGNLFLSPHAISESLTMLYAGAANGTQSAMRSALQLTLPDNELQGAMNSLELELVSRGQGQPGANGQPFSLTIANAIWGPQGGSFLESYLDTIALDYGATLQLFDFALAPDAAASTIDAWVAQQTQSKIPSIIAPGTLTPDTRLVLTSGVSFNAPWLTSFDSSQTSSLQFTSTNDGFVSAPMMVSTADYPVYDGNGVLAVSLPYAGQQLSMLIIEPDDLATFEAGFTGAAFDAIVAGLTPKTIELHLPKWSFTTPSNLEAPLSALGMSVIFDGSNADFSGMDAQRDLYVSNLAHEAYIEVDEAGVNASSTMVLAPPVDGVAPGTGAIVIDHPFVFAIRDEVTGALLFLGRVADPTAAQ
jgi:serpin B